MEAEKDRNPELKYLKPFFFLISSLTLFLNMTVNKWGPEDPGFLQGTW